MRALKFITGHVIKPGLYLLIPTENHPRAGQYLAFLKENLGLSYEDVHVLGFSLGGQLVAFIGQELNGVLPRITGLDPAGKYRVIHGKVS